MNHLLHAIWGPEYNKEKNYLHVFLHNLRKKIEPDLRKPEYIVTVFGVGYIFKHEKKE
jgi:two-component system KDP operon response regulator KdpE